VNEATQVAIVTGGGRGIGQAVATALAAHGFAVAVVARSGGEVERATAAIQSRGGRATALVADVARAESAEETVAEAERRLGGACHILVNAAGIAGPVAEVADIDLDSWRATIDINLTGAFAMSRAVLPALRTRRSGRIVNVTSGLARRAQPGLGAYSVSKAGLLHLTRVIDAEAKHDGVRAFAVEPGVVRTAMSDSLMSLNEPGVQASVVQMFKDAEAGPGFSDPEDAARLIELLATGQADDLAGEACSLYDPEVRARIFEANSAGLSPTPRTSSR
jgi:NAD(P)-dependent dehydrogenase (short-subunit alcohol dehydrogenase family)